MAKIATATLVLLALAPAGVSAEGNGNGNGFELGVFYGVSFTDVHHRTGGDWGWGEQAEDLDGGFVQGVSLSRRIGDHVLAEVGFALGPGREITRDDPVWPYRDTEPIPGCIEDPGVSGCPSPPVPSCAEDPSISACLIPPYGRFTERVTSYEYGASVTVALAGKDLVPYLTVGVGGVTYAFTDWTETDMRFAFGAGVRRYFGRLGLRLEAVDLVSTDSFLTGRVEHDVQVRAGLQVRLP